MKKIYFAGSIRGGRVDAELYGRLIKYMQKTAVVLTEHVGSPHLNLIEQGKRDMEIYDHPAHWSNRKEYRLMDPGSNNFFRVKAEVIRNMGD